MKGFDLGLGRVDMGTTDMATTMVVYHQQLIWDIVGESYGIDGWIFGGIHRIMDRI